MRQIRNATSWLVVLLLALTLTSCSARKPETQNVQSPTPTENVTPNPTPVPETITMPVYFSDRQAQYQLPEAREMAKAEGAALATQVVKAILAGPQDPYLVRTFPAEVKLMEPVKVEAGIAYVNLSREVLKVQGSAGVSAALGSLRLSLTEISGITKVYLLAEGEKNVYSTWQLVDGPTGRGPIRTWPVLSDPERAKALQAKADAGTDTWRTDAAKVVAWDGRMFCFTADELKTAKVTENGNQATANVTSGGVTYTLKLQRQTGGKGPGIWLITGIAGA